jgi:hypothetical protein
VRLRRPRCCARREQLGLVLQNPHRQSGTQSMGSCVFNRAEVGASALVAVLRAASAFGAFSQPAWELGQRLPLPPFAGPSTDTCGCHLIAATAPDLSSLQAIIRRGCYPVCRGWMAHATQHTPAAQEQGSLRRGT